MSFQLDSFHSVNSNDSNQHSANGIYMNRASGSTSSHGSASLANQGLPLRPGVRPSQSIAAGMSARTMSQHDAAPTSLPASHSFHHGQHGGSFSSDLGAIGSSVGGGVVPSSTASTPLNSGVGLGTETSRNTSFILIESLVQRLTKRLPHVTGEPLASVENDSLTCSCVANIVRHSQYQLPAILRELIGVFDSLNKASLAMSEERIQIDIMQSQLLMLEVLAACLIEFWRASLAKSEGQQHSQSAQNLQDDIPKGWADPPPLDDGLAKQLLSIATLFLRQMTTREEALLSQSNAEARAMSPEKAKGRDDDYDIGVEGATFAALALTHGTGLFVLHPNFPPIRSPFPVTRTRDGQTTSIKKPRFDSGAVQSIVAPTPYSEQDPAEKMRVIIHSIYRQASQVIFFVSSSNWHLVHSRMRNRLNYLTSPNDEATNISELRLMECSNLNQKRLSIVIQEVNSVFPRLKRQAQHLIALVLRRAIWTWIQYHPAEFAYHYATGSRLDNSPDQLFDNIYSLLESTKRKLVYWPVLTSLLILCPDSIGKIVQADPRRMMGQGNKKTAFVDSLRKSMRSAKLADVAALCCIDLCKAATCTAMNDASVRLLVSEICDGLQEKLYDQRRTFTHALGSIEVPLLVEAFVALYRLDSQRTLRDLVPVLLSDSSPIAFKVALVRGCIQMVGEKNRLPWNANIMPLIAQTSAPLRQTFKAILARVLKGGGLAMASKRSKGKSEDLAARNEILASIIQLWTTDTSTATYGVTLNAPETVPSPMWAVGGPEEEDMLQSMMQVDSLFTLGYAASLAVRSPELGSINQLALKAGTVFVVKLENMPDGPFVSAARDSSAAIFTLLTTRIAQNLAQAGSPAQQHHWLPMLSAALKQNLSMLVPVMDNVRSERRQYLASHSELVWESNEIEKALLISLCSIDLAVCSQTLHVCAEFAQNRRKAAAYHIYSQEWTRLFEDLGQLATVHTGRLALQKRILARLRQMDSSSPAIVATWEELYNRWSAATPLVVRPQDSTIQESAQEMASQWHNYSSFLALLGGTCILGQRDQSQLREAKTAAYHETEDQELIRQVESFIQEMVDLLVSESIWVREKVKDALGNEMSVRLGGVLLSMIHSVISDFFDRLSGLPKPSDTYSLFIEHSISVIQLLLSRLEEPNESSVQVDIGALMVLYIEYLNSLPQSEGAARMRTSMSQVCEVIMQKKNCFNFKNELRVRNRLLQVLAGWTTESIEELHTSEKMNRLQRDLDAACLRAIAALLDKLPLLLPEDAPLLDDKIEHTKSRQFATYFNYFIKILNRTNAKDKETSASSNSRRRTPNNELSALKRSAILALSNLLASNIETGLQLSLPLAYHDDVQQRAAFMQIITNILGQGTAFDRLERVSPTDKHSRLTRLICEPDMQLALAMCNVGKGYDDSGIDRILLNTFDSHGGTIHFLKAALREEIERTTTEEMVFRSNSFRTHLLSTFGRTHGYDYLRTILEPLMLDMATKPRGYSYEIDSQKLEAGEMVIVNQHRLEQIAQAFIDRICSSADRVPAVMRELCRHIRLLMDQRFPSSRYQGVGGFIFLRFINPAVVAPQIIDIEVPHIGKEMRRGLLLVSKILQTLASNTLFPAHKEPFMTSLNEFLKHNVWKITTFLDQVSDGNVDAEQLAFANQPMGSGIHPSGTGVDDTDRRHLLNFFSSHIDKIRTDLAQRASQAEAESVSTKRKSEDTRISIEAPAADPRRIYDAVSGILSELGKIKDEAIVANQSSDAPKPIYADFMSKHQGRNIDEERNRTIFYEGARSRAGRRVFYYNAWANQVQTIDYEGLVYYILTILSTVNEPFDMIFDCTGVDSMNHLIPVSWMSYLNTLFPPKLASNLRNAIGFNVNSPCVFYCRKWMEAMLQDARSSEHQVSSGMLSELSMSFVSTLQDLEAHIERRNIALHPRTLAICAAKVEKVYDGITMVWYYRSLTPVVFKLTDSHLQITTKKKVTAFFDSQGYQNEVIALAEIDDVRAVSTRGDENTFCLSARDGVVSFVFMARDRTSIIQGLRQAKAQRPKLETSDQDSQIGRRLLPSDVPGTLLNMAMLNTTSLDTQLRVSAYDLLCALSTSFNFGGGNARRRLHSAKGLVLSANSINFLADISSDFATAAPGVTLEFLTSFFEGFERTNTEQKLACLHYMAAWLPNMGNFIHTSREQQAEYQARIKAVVRQLIAITVKEQAIFTVMQRSVWVQLRGLDNLVPLLLDVFTEAAMDAGLHTEQFQRTLDIMVSFASMNLRGKLLSRLRRVISRTGQSPTVSSLHENPAWKEIATLAHMNLALSFSNRTENIMYLPEILHVILLLAGIGEDATRFAIHGTAVNLVHSLCTEESTTLSNLNGRSNGLEETSSEIESGSEKIGAPKRLRNLLSRLSTDEFLSLFGLPLTQSEAYTGHVSSAKLSIARETPSNAAIATLAAALYEIPEMAAPTIDAGNSWRARIVSLVTSKAFQYNPIIQARAFILLGCMGDLTKSLVERNKHSSTSSAQSKEGTGGRLSSPFEVDDDLLYQILVSLRGSIQEWSSEANDSVVISIVICLSKIVQILPEHSRYLPQIFWLGISLIQYGHAPLFKAAVDLLYASISSICDRDLPSKNNADLITFLLDGRMDFHEAATTLDDETGVDFEINFSFGVVALLVKGLSRHDMRDSTTQLLEALLKATSLDSSGHQVSESSKVSIEQIGFFVALLPTAATDKKLTRLLELAGVPHDAAQSATTFQQRNAARAGESQDETGYFALVEPMENKIALLVVTLVSSLLRQTSISDPEKQLLYGFLAEAAREFPAIVSILYDHLLPSMREVYFNSQNQGIIRAVDTIAQVAISGPIFQLQAAETQKRGGAEAYLDEAGYASLLDCGSFELLKEERRLTLTKLCDTMLSELIDAGTM